MFLFDGAMFAMGLKQAQIERERFNALGPEQKQLELRLREVRALEQQAEALRERNRIERNKFF